MMLSCLLARPHPTPATTTFNMRVCGSGRFAPFAETRYAGSHTPRR